MPSTPSDSTPPANGRIRWSAGPRRATTDSKPPHGGRFSAVGLDDLPGRQREVVVLRDVEGLSSDEVCIVLDISVGNQRVLLHRGRTRLREILEAQRAKA